MSICGCQQELIVGDIQMTARDSAPSNWLMLTGPNKAGWVEKSVYPELWTAIGDKFNDNDPTGGSGRPSTGHFYVGIDESLTMLTQYDSPGSGVVLTGDSGDKLGGSASVVLAMANLPSSGVSVSAALTDATVGGTLSGLTFTHTGTTSPGSVTTSDAHTHPPGTAGRSFVTAVGVDSGTGLSQYQIDTAGTDVIAVQVGAPDNLAVPQQTNNQNTGSGGGKSVTRDDIFSGVTINGSVTGTISGISVTTDTVTGTTSNLGTDDPIDITPEHFRSHLKIKAR